MQITSTKTEFKRSTEEVRARKAAYFEMHLPGDAVGRVERIIGREIELSKPSGAVLVRQKDIIVIEGCACRVEERLAFLGGQQLIIVDHVPPGAKEGSFLYLVDIEFVPVDQGAEKTDAATSAH